MILGFKQNFPWQEPTYFREKILCAVGYGVVEENGKCRVVKPREYVLEIIKNLSGISPKIHTIREDAHDRWKLGRSIQMVYRGPKYSILHHFNKGIPELEECRQLQTISIQIRKYKADGWWAYNIDIGEKYDMQMRVEIDGIPVHYKSETENDIWKNDGFNSVLDFYNWFKGKENFKGKIIGWTDFKY